MADYLPQASTTGQTGHGHEANVLVVKGLIVFAVVLVAVGIIVELCLVYVMKDFSREEKVLQALAPPTLTDDAGPFVGPRLQAEPPIDLVKLKESELSHLNGYGWVDREAGIAHIPIERAIAIVASRGLPAGGGSAEKNAETTPAAKPTAAAEAPEHPNVKHDRKP
jgi:hypothetical protein